MGVGGTNIKVEVLNTRPRNFNLLVIEAYGVRYKRKIFQETIFGWIGKAFDTTDFLKCSLL